MALTQLADGHYLMMVTGGSNDTLAFYRSTITDLTSENLLWVPLDSCADTMRQTDPRNPDYCGPGSTPSDGDCLSPDELYMGANWPTTGGGNGNRTRRCSSFAKGRSTARCFLPAPAAASLATTSSTFTGSSAIRRSACPESRSASSTHRRVT